MDFSAPAWARCMPSSGENGAGKSTLVKILSGALPCDPGEILLDGKPGRILWLPLRARHLGIYAVYQEFSLVRTPDHHREHPAGADADDPADMAWWIGSKAHQQAQQKLARSASPGSMCARRSPAERLAPADGGDRQGGCRPGRRI